MKQKIRLTKSEREIMDVLWKQGEALTSSEIIEVSTNRSWGNTSIHLLLKSLLDKSVIEVDGFKRIAKNYARTFVPVETREQFLVIEKIIYKIQ